MKYQSTCISCFKKFLTYGKWQKKCPKCVKEKAPKRKKLINPNIKPF